MSATKTDEPFFAGGFGVFAERKDLKMIKCILTTNEKKILAARRLSEQTEKTTEGVKNHLRFVPKKNQLAYLRAINGDCSARAAIKQKCYECAGFENIQENVYECNIRTCPIWSFRPKPKTTGLT